jgi:GMP reductase
MFDCLPSLFSSIKTAEPSEPGEPSEPSETAKTEEIGSGDIAATEGDKISSDIKLDFSNVLIVPKISPLNSRNDVDLEREIVFDHSKRAWKGIPIIVANMDTTGTVEMARVCQKHHIITCLHKFHKADDIPDDLDRNYFAVSIGTRPNDMENLVTIMEKVKPYFICLDIANGYSTHIFNVIQDIRRKYPDVTLIAGNVVTYEMVEQYYNRGVDIVKMGIGSGSVCTTRLQTGIGYPQFSCIYDTRVQINKNNKNNKNNNKNINSKIHIISDGGIQYAGDFSKAFGAGADFVMCGGLFAGHEECAGETVVENDVKYKVFYGMSSSNAMIKHYGSVSNYRVAEGKCVKLKHRGAVEQTILDILGGIRSTLTYVGAAKMEDVFNNATFIKVNNVANTIYNGREV